MKLRFLFELFFALRSVEGYPFQLQWQKSYWFRWNNCKKSLEHVTRFRFSSTVSNRGTHLTDSFFMFKWGWKLLNFINYPSEKPTTLAISRIFNSLITLQSANFFFSEITVIFIFSYDRGSHVILILSLRNARECVC